MDEEIKREIDKLRREIAALGQLGQGTTVYGDLMVTGAVDIRAGRFWAVDENGMPRLAMSSINLKNEFGIDAHFAGFDANGIPRFWFSADNGSGVFAGGHGVISTCISLSGMRRALELTAIGNTGFDPRRARIELVPGGLQNEPQLSISYADVTENPNLVTNGAFATGDATDWIPGIGGDQEFTVESVFGGYAGRLYNPASSVANMFARTPNITIDPNTHYEIAGEIWSEGDYTWPRAVVAFLDASSNPISSHALFDDSILAYALAPTNFARTVKSPANAATMYIQIQNFATESASATWFTNIACRKINLFHELRIGKNGLSALQWDDQVTAGVHQNFTNAGASNAQTLTIRVLRDAIKVKSLAWDIRISGGYSVRHTYSGDKADTYGTIWTGSAPGNSEVVMNLEAPLVLLRGLHYLTLVKDTGTGTLYTNTSYPYTAPSGDFIIERAYTDGVLSANVAPVVVTYSVGHWT